MSLGVVVQGPEGVVLASDSRLSLTAQRKGGPPLPVDFDNATKLLTFSGQDQHRYVGAVTYGAAVIGLRSAHSLMPEFAVELEEEERLEVEEYAHRLSAFFLHRWEQVVPEDYTGPPMTFIVGGYDRNAAYGRVFLIEIPSNPEPVEQHPGVSEFGMTWGGQLDVASRVIQGYDPSVPGILHKELGMSDSDIERVLNVLKRNLRLSVPYEVLPLQDCIDLATFMIRTTMDAQSLSVARRGVGGPIDVAVITRTEPIKYIQRKSLEIH